MASTGTLDVPRGRLWARIKTASLPSRLALLVALLSLFAVVGTYSLQSGLLPIRATADQLLWLILTNSSLALILAALMGWRLWLMWREQRSGVAGARLHVRLIGLFAVVAVVPIVVVALFAAVTFNLSVQAWFSRPVRGVLENAAIVANRYQADFENLLRADAEIVSSAIERDPQIFAGSKVDTALLFARLHELTRDRHLLASYLIDAKGNVLGSTIPVDAPPNLQHLKPPSAENIRLASANDHQVVIDASSVYGQERALIRLPIFAQPIFLLVVRPIDPVVLSYYQQTISALDRYHSVAKMMANTQFIFAALYILVAFLTLLVAVWLGIWAAEELVDPISRLILAAERVAKGDLRAQVRVARGDSEMSRLGRAFNRMTGQLSAQRDELVEASHQIDIRRRFMEAVLAGVSAGVIGLDADGHIALVNRAAARLLNAEPEEMEGAHYAEAVPELAGLIRRAMAEPVARASGEASVKRAGATQTLSVQVDSDLSGGFVVTFDDITDLMSAQRTAAWADVARRIAHEIKNPLTPIQLAAERLKRKYSREIESDPEIFAQCTDTIIRQVGDIGRMVDEFSSFARMPAPVMSPNNFQELLQQAVFLQRVGNSDIAYEVRAPKEPVRLICDGRLLSQALTNVLKNAGEAIAARHAKGDDVPGQITAALTVADGIATLAVSDNGIGLPAEHRHRLTEPYVTTRAKGTGLGLAIVRKIVEDHGGEIIIGDRSDDLQGAEVRLQFPIQPRVMHALEMEGEHEQERIADRA